MVPANHPIPYLGAFPPLSRAAAGRAEPLLPSMRSTERSLDQESRNIHNSRLFLGQGQGCSQVLVGMDSCVSAVAAELLLAHMEGS